MSKGILKLEQEQNDFEDALLMDASFEDIKNDKEAKKVFKFINKRKSYINFIKFLDKKGVI